MPPGAGLVVRRDVGALAEGLEAFLAGDVPASTLDVERYNEAAMREFEAAITARGGDGTT
ncbi:MAG: hypothetical protein JWR20_2728, partial [Marmoricola sp.]|nr:hypothetical protein [Marmoricola sp.]